MLISRTASFGIGAVMALVIGSGTAYAATGGTFVLGKSNVAGRTTTLANKKGTALALNSPVGAPPLRVNRSIKVPDLNADLLDGMDQSDFALASGSVRAYDVPGVAYDFNNNAKPDAIIAAASCPKGTQRTGGGVTDKTSTGIFVSSAPDPKVANSWAAAVLIDEAATENPANLTVTIVCYSPRGNPIAGYRTGDLSVAPSSDLKAVLAAKVAARHW